MCVGENFPTQVTAKGDSLFTIRWARGISKAPWTLVYWVEEAVSLAKYFLVPHFFMLKRVPIHWQIIKQNEGGRC